MHWNDILMDLSLLKRFGIKDWSELSAVDERSGLIVNSSNRIEIKRGSRIMERFYSEELIHQKTLFPTFNAESIENEITFKEQLIIVQYETGLIAKYKIDNESIVIDDLIFAYETPLLPQTDILLTNLKYKGNILRKHNEDTIVRGVRVITT